MRRNDHPSRESVNECVNGHPPHESGSENESDLDDQQVKMGANGCLQQNESVIGDAREHAREKNANVDESVRVNESVHQNASETWARQENVSEKNE